MDTVSFSFRSICIAVSSISLCIVIFVLGMHYLIYVFVPYRKYGTVSWSGRRWSASLLFMHGSGTVTDSRRYGPRIVGGGL